MAGSARDNMNVLGALENLGRGGAERGLEQAAAGDPLLQGVGDGAGLLVNLFQHEVAVLPLFRGVRR